MDRERTAVMVARLKELSYATAEQQWREFSMRVPADTERDADLVLMRAAMFIERLCEALKPLAECHLPPAGFEQHGVTAHFTTAQIVAAKDAMTPNAKVSGAGTASAGLPGYADGGNGERK